VETSELLLEDFQNGALNQAPEPSREAVERRLALARIRVVSWTDWLRLDQLEKQRGAALGRPRLKFTRVEEMLAALDT
jgi:ferredoxin--NADP+ reductase